MAVSKFTNDPNGKEISTKINDVIDAMGTVKSVNSTSPDSNGNVSLTIPAAQVQSNWNETNTSSKAYIQNKPTIPTVNNATLTIQKNSTTVKTFTANASSNVTCNITVPTKVSELTNDSGFVTTDNDTKYTAGSSNSTSKLFLVGATAQGTAATNAQAKTTYSNSAVYEQNGYLYATTPTNSTNDTTVATTAFVKAQGYTSNTGTVTSVNNVAPISGNVTLSIPTYNFNGEPFYSTNGNATTITRDCNALTANGHYYYTSNGPSGLGEQSTDGAVYVQGYNDLWVTQIAQDYRTGNLFVRSRNSGTWTAWKAIGTSSGANTDLSNLSATGKAKFDAKVNKSGDTMTGDLIVSKSSANDDSFIEIKNTDISGLSIPSSNSFSSIDFKANDDSVLGRVLLRNTTTAREMRLRVDSFSGAYDDALCVGFNTNNKAYCTFPNTTCVDSVYSNTNANITSSATSLNGSTNLPYTLSSLPNDGRNYMVLISGTIETGSASGNRGSLNVSSDLATSWIELASVRTRTSSTMQAAGACWIPVSSSRKIYVERNSNYNATFTLHMRGYRRIGTNS